MSQPQPPLHLGLDLGGTKIAAALLDASGAVLWEQRVPTPQGDYQGTIAALVALCDAARRAFPAMENTVGIAPQELSRLSQGASRTPTASYSTASRCLPTSSGPWAAPSIRLANDANCFALSEATDGAAEGADIVFGVILSTGTGGGIVVGGQLLQGCVMPMPVNGPQPPPPGVLPTSIQVRPAIAVA